MFQLNYLLPGFPRSAPYRLKGKVEIRSQAPRVCAWNTVSACFRSGSSGRHKRGSEERKGRGRAASLQDTKPGTTLFASLTKENEGLEPGWLELTLEKPLL